MIEGIDERLKDRAWKRESNYIGEDLEGYYIIYSHNRDSTLVTESNWDTLKEMFKDNPRVRILNFNHWLCGWVECFMINGEEMTIEDYNQILDIINRLEDYPLLDESDYSNREFESTLENISSEMHYAISDYDTMKEFDSMEDKEICKKVFDWLWTNDQNQLETVDDTGGFPSKESIVKALLALNLIKESE